MCLQAEGTAQPSNEFRFFFLNPYLRTYGRAPLLLSGPAFVFEIGEKLKIAPRNFLRGD